MAFDPYSKSNIRSLANPYFKPIANAGGQPKTESNFGAGWDVANGVLGLAGNYMNMANQSLNLNTNIAPSQYDQNSAPTYTAGQAQIEASNATPQRASGGELLGGALQGAGAGAALGPAGMVVGGVVGALSSAFGGESREEKQRREKQIALQKVMASQQLYNSQDVSFRNQQNQREDYLQRMNPRGREYNVYKTRF